MKKIFTLGGFVAACLCLVLGTSVRAATDAQISVTASINAVNNLNASLEKNSDASAATTMAFGAHNSTENPWSTAGLAPYYVKISVDKNDSNWRLRLTTKNLQNIQAMTPDDVAITTNTWGYSYGGLVSTTTAGGKIPFAWRVSTTTAVNAYPPVGNPAVEFSTWTFVKDQEDYDDPKMAGNQSFDWVDQNTGYCNIAYGGPGYTTAITLPRDVPSLPGRTDSFKLYINGNFNGAKAAGYGPAPANATYKTAATQNKLFLDLLNEI